MQRMWDINCDSPSSRAAADAPSNGIHISSSGQVNIACVSKSAMAKRNVISCVPMAKLSFLISPVELDFRVRVKARQSQFDNFNFLFSHIPAKFLPPVATCNLPLLSQPASNTR